MREEILAGKEAKVIGEGGGGEEGYNGKNGDCGVVVVGVGIVVVVVEVVGMVDDGYLGFGFCLWLEGEGCGFGASEGGRVVKGTKGSWRILLLRKKGWDEASW